MSTECEVKMTDDILIIGRKPFEKYITLGELQRISERARKIRALCICVLETTTQKELTFGPNGTSITMKGHPLFRKIGYGRTDKLTALIPALNAWLERRSHAVMSEADPSAMLADLDREIEAYGYSNLGATLLKLASSHECQLLIENPTGEGGLLVIPPSSLLAAPPLDIKPATDSGQSQTVSGVTSLTLLTTTNGSIYVLPTSSVSEGVRAGTTARVRHSREKDVQWQTAFGFIVEPEENS